ncbi:hypothetical protein B0H11DRAFT_2282251 [Mycena galericulata]|nr:hypothetical protein B0H11DRAFT_2282251 [Mycena galericulata]
MGMVPTNRGWAVLLATKEDWDRIGQLIKYMTCDNASKNGTVFIAIKEDRDRIEQPAKENWDPIEQHIKCITCDNASNDGIMLILTGNKLAIKEDWDPNERCIRINQGPGGSGSGNSTAVVTKKKSHAGEIAGGVVGGLVLLVCLAAAFRWRQRTAQPHAPDIDQGTLKLGGGAVRPTWLGGAVAQPSASAGGNPLSEADMAAQLRALTDKVEHLERERREATRSPNATGAGNDASSGMPWYGGASGGASRDRDALEAMKRQQTSVVIQDQEKAQEAPPTYLAAWGGS